MDIFSHAFWTAVAAKSANFKIKHFKKRRPISAIWSAVWGIAPDIFAFAPIFVSSAIIILFGSDGVTVFDIPRPSEVEPTDGNGLFIFKLTRALYNIGHSAVIFGVVFVLAYFIFKRVRWEMLGWFLHIIIDIPTHSYKFYPTPAFWPLAEWKFDGVAWGTPWFMALNISAIGLVSLFYFLHTHRKNKP
jgi:hypothetical protein